MTIARDDGVPSTVSSGVPGRFSVGRLFTSVMMQQQAQKAFALRLNLRFKDFVARTKPLAVLLIEF